MIAQIIDTWIGSGINEDYIRPSIMDSPHNITKWEDVTGQQSPPNTPNSVVIQVEAGKSVIDAIEADGNYQVLWTNDN